MRRVVCGLLLVMTWGVAAMAAEEGGGVLPATMEKYQKVRVKVESLAGTPAAKYAPEVVADADRSIAAAQEGLKAGSERATREAVETALLQTTLAGVLADERMAAERASAAKVELERLEQRLAAILAGKGDR